jgi:hypothetical protein
MSQTENLCVSKSIMPVPVNAYAVDGTAANIL